MAERSIRLHPSGIALTVEDGGGLQDVLFDHGVEFPCGGRGLCKGCRVKVLEGTLPVNHEERERLTSEELAQGWRLACMARVTSDLTLELAQWEAAILSDNTRFEFEPRTGAGIAIDLGTTTIAAQLLDLSTGNVLAVETALNSQARLGADIMSRIEYAVAGRGQAELTGLIRAQVGNIVSRLKRQAGGVAPLSTILIAGNTVMHHLFCGISVEPLSHFPFEPAKPGTVHFTSGELRWNYDLQLPVTFLPCPGGFVGSDILAGILATGMHEEERLCALMDLGTNGEIVVGTREKLLCASTAAGPAFEGARISCGMRASTGAISEVSICDGALSCHVLGNTSPKGVCGSGLVDAVAAGLELKKITPRGRLLSRDTLPLAGDVELTQWDIRELQMAKGAIAAGLRVLLGELGAGINDLQSVYLAGAFGNYISVESGRRIGLFQARNDIIQSAGNSALHGVKRMLFEDVDVVCDRILSKVTHVSLHQAGGFQDMYVEEMGFPAEP